MYDRRFCIYVDVDTYKAFQEGRERLGLSENTYLRNLLGQDFTVKVKFKHVDLNQTRLYQNKDLKPESGD